MSIDPQSAFFPPFPKPPPGVHIMPFSKFRERGIKIAPGPDNQEVDALGIPTVPLGTKHANDVCKTKAIKKRKRDEKAPLVVKMWWDHWQEVEANRKMKNLDMKQTDFERIYHAVVDFRSGRPWPPSHKLLGPGYIWEQIKKFIGVPDYPPVNLENRLARFRKSESDEEDEDEDSDMDHPVLRDFIPDEDSDPEEGNIETDPTLTPAAFLADPSGRLKIFLSSWSLARGLLWSEKNLAAIPRLLAFFLNFLIRSGPFPKQVKQFRKALAVVDRAALELPLGAEIPKRYPEPLAKNLRNLWGSMGSHWEITSIEPMKDQVDEENDEPESKKLRGEPENDGWTSGSQTALSNNGWGNSTEDDAKADGWGDSTTDNGWSDNTGWGAAGDNPWAEVIANKSQNKDKDKEGKTSTTEADVSVPVQSAPLPAALEVHVPARTRTLSELIGDIPASLIPHTHIHGIVETSMRRIVSIKMPMQMDPSTASENNETVVEQALVSAFARVVLEPWLGWDASGAQGYLTAPTIEKKSRGGVILPTALSASAPSNPGRGNIPKKKGRAAQPLTTSLELLTSGQNVNDESKDVIHDPCKHSITLLVDPEMAALFREHMGIGGRWVQIIRSVDLEAQEKSKNKGEIYWYMDELTVIIPSFWTDAPESKETSNPNFEMD